MKKKRRQKEEEKWKKREMEREIERECVSSLSISIQSIGSQVETGGRAIYVFTPPPPQLHPLQEPVRFNAHKAKDARLV